MPNDNVIDKLSIEIEAQTGDVTRRLGKVVSALKVLSNTLSGISMPKLNFGISKASLENLKTLSDTVKSMDFVKFRALTEVSKGVSFFNLGIDGKAGAGLKSLADGIKAISGADIERMRVLSSMDFTNMRDLADASRVIRRLRERVKELSEGDKEATGAKKGLANATKNLSDKAKNAEKSQKTLARSTNQVRRATHSAHHTFNLANTALGKLFNSIKRIAFYRMIRSAIKSVTQGFAEGIENLYRWSQAWNTSFAPAMDQLATAQLYLKNGFASMFSPLIEKAIPILDALIDKVVDVFNVIQELFAKLTGAPTWNKALKYPVTYKEELDDTAKSAKALQNILMDFDEINAINTPNSGSGGSGKEAEDYSKMFELMETGEGIFGSLGSTWLGKFLGDLGGKILKVYGHVKKFWEFLKGLNFKPLKDALKALWDEALSPILDELNDDAGWLQEKVLQPITQFLVEKGIPAAVDLLKTAIQNLWKAFKPLKDGIKGFWDENGSWIMEMLEEHTMTAIGKIKEAFEAIGDWFSNNDSISDLFADLKTIFSYLSPIIKKLASILGTQAWDTFVSSIRNILDALSPIIDVVSGIFDIIAVYFTGDGKQFTKGLKKIGTALLDSILYPIKIVLRAIADLTDALGFKEAAHKIRVALGDETKYGNGFGMSEEEAAELLYNTEAVGEAGEATTAVLREEGDEFIKTAKKAVPALEKVGATADMTAGDMWDLFQSSSEYAEMSQEDILDVWEYLENCNNYGVNPLTSGFEKLNSVADGFGNAAESIGSVQTASENLITVLSGLDDEGREAFMSTAAASQYCKQWGLDPFTGKVITAKEVLDVINGDPFDDVEDAANYATIAIAALDPKSREVLTGLTTWCNWCEENGLDPLTGKMQALGGSLSNLKTGAEEGFSGVETGASDLATAFTSWFGTDMAWTLGYNYGSAISKGAQNALNMSPVQIKATLSADISGVNVNDKWRAALAAAGISLAGFASGGFPVPGSLFYAGENNVPELMGTIGGRTAVAGGEEITGIRDAIIEQGQADRQMMSRMISAIQNKDLTLVANSRTGRWVNQAMKAYAGVTG